jgi:hypothetical protein
MLVEAGALFVDVRAASTEHPSRSSKHAGKAAQLVAKESGGTGEQHTPVGFPDPQPIHRPIAAREGETICASER